MEKERQINLEYALGDARRAFQLPGIAASPSALVKANLIMGKACLNRCNDSSYLYLKSALALSDSIGLNKHKAQIFYYLSKISLAALDYKQCIILLDTVTKLAEREKDYNMLASAYNEIGGIHVELHDRDKARSMFELAYTTAMKHKLYKPMGAALGNLALLETDPNKIVRMQMTAVGLLKLAPATGEAIAMMYINIGAEFETPDSAIKYYLAAIHAIDPRSSGDVIMGAYNNLALSYADKGEYGKAEDCLLTTAMPIAEKSGNTDWYATMYDTYADILNRQGRYREAGSAWQKAFKYQEEANNYRVNGQVRLLSALLDSKNKEVILKSKDQEIQQKNNKINLLILLFILVTAVTILTFIWVILRSRLKSERQRFASAKKIIEMEDQYKIRLSMDLHDMTGPIYTTLMRQIEEVNIPDHSIRDGLSESLNTLANRIRHISHEMAGGYYEHMPFDEMIRDLCREMQFRTKSKIILSLDPEVKSLNGEKTQHILRIIQELLTNGVKHAVDSEINIGISMEESGLTIFYRDNGPGFDISSGKHTGIGLTNIHERSRLIGGQALLHSEHGTGTRWRIMVPLNNN